MPIVEYREVRFDGMNDPTLEATKRVGYDYAVPTAQGRKEQAFQSGEDLARNSATTTIKPNSYEEEKEDQLAVTTG